MPQTETPFVIGVIREKEKQLLEADEFTRISHGKTVRESVAAMTDTAYGIHLSSGLSVQSAIEKRLQTEFEWLVSMLGKDHAVIPIISIRYDLMRIATAIMQFQNKEEVAHTPVTIGLLTDELLTSVIWHGEGWDDVPRHLRSVLEKEIAAVKEDSWSASDLLARMEEHTITTFELLADSPLTRELVTLAKEQSEEEATLRPNTLPEDIAAFEHARDEKVLSLLRPYRAEPVANDAIIAWWTALTIEAKVLRMLLNGKAGGVPETELTKVPRSLYRDFL